MAWRREVSLVPLLSLLSFVNARSSRRMPLEMISQCKARQRLIHWIGIELWFWKDGTLLYFSKLSSTYTEPAKEPNYGHLTLRLNLSEKHFVKVSKKKKVRDRASKYAIISCHYFNKIKKVHPKRRTPMDLFLTESLYRRQQESVSKSCVA